MNRAELRQKHAKTLALRVRPHADTARAWIADALEDAEVHARAAIGQIPTNQPAFVGLARSGSMEAANKRLDNLGHAILSIVQKARIEFYVHSYKIQEQKARPAIHRMDVVPTREGAIAVRDALIHGRSLPGDITQAIDGVKFSLKAAVSQGNDAALRGWRKATTDQLQAKVNGWLSDSSHAIYSAVSWSMVKPELRPALKK